LTPASSPSSAAKAAFIIRAVRCAEKSSSREDTVWELSAEFCASEWRPEWTFPIAAC
jgi:hypothetical protein